MTSFAAAPAIRVRPLVDVAAREDADHVLYWMTANRRPVWNFALDHAVALAAERGLPLVVLEPLRCGYRWASDRFQAFVAQGMADNAAAFARAGIAYHPYLEPEDGAGRGLLEAWAARAAVVVGDDWPCFFHPRMQAAAAKHLAAQQTRFEVVDSNGILPIRAAGEQVFLTAYSFRRFLQKNLPAHLGVRPRASLPPAGTLPSVALPTTITDRWPVANDLSGSAASLAALPIDHRIAPLSIRGGDVAGRARLHTFMAQRFERYDTDRSGPDLEGQSGLSPWLHWGHLSVHEVVDQVFQREGFTPEQLAPRATGSREGWWGLSSAAEGFLDELITWREIGFNMCARRSDYDQFSSLPQWAQDTLLEHASDPRPHCYSLEQLDAGETYDALWNAAQRQLRDDGIIQNYLRMLWGKKILEWSRTPVDALEHLIELNNRYAIDGRDPNSYSGIFWVLGRYDRPWGPKRPVFGAIRYMSSDNTAKKHPVKNYLRQYGDAEGTTTKKTTSTTRQTNLFT